METPRVVWSFRAQTDLLEIEEYIAIHDGEPRAEHVIGRLNGAIRSLAFTPGMGRGRNYLRSGALAFPVTPWIVIYRPLPSLDGIRILRVLDGRRDLPRLFR